MRKMLLAMLFGVFSVCLFQPSLFSWEEEPFSLAHRWGKEHSYSWTFSFAASGRGSQIRIAEEHDPPESNALQTAYSALLMRELGPNIKVKEAGRPPLSGGKLLAEVVAGTAAWCGTFLLIRRTTGSLIVTLSSSALVSSLIVYGIGNIGKSTGSFMGSFAGSLTGTLVLTAVALAMWSSSVDLGPAWIIILTLPAIGATVGFNATRRYKTSQQNGNALINVKDKKLCLSFPAIQFIPGPAGKSISLSCALLNVEI